MFSKVLVKLVDQAIVPALIVFASRIASLLFFSSYFDINFSVNQNGIVFSNPQDYLLVNSYSIMVMVATLTVALLYNLLKAYYFHDTHITPGLTSKLFSMKLSSLIQSSMEVYSEGVIWLSYSFLLTVIAGLMTIFGLCYIWVFFTSLCFTAISGVLFLLDVEKELFASRSVKPSRQETVLNFGNISL